MKVELKKWLPFSLTFIIVFFDQYSKNWVVNKLPRVNDTLFSIGNGFFRLVHVRNLGGPFSIGDSLPTLLRLFIMIYVPFLLLVIVVVYYIWDKDLSSMQRWSLTGIVGGGLGNLIDRIFRPLGVIDFLDFKIYGLFGLDRWPVFNVADAAVIISTGLLLVTFLRQEFKGNQ